MKRKKRIAFNDKPMSARIAQKFLDGLLSAAAVYLATPYLYVYLAPIQAQLNAALTKKTT